MIASMHPHSIAGHALDTGKKYQGLQSRQQNGGFLHVGDAGLRRIQSRFKPSNRGTNMNGNRFYGVRVEGAKYGVGFGSALAIAISYTANHSILWAIIHGILGWLYVVYFALFRS
jgi:hypothetical protein